LVRNTQRLADMYWLRRAARLFVAADVYVGVSDAMQLQQ
jgi:hypothetical protein